MPTRNVNLTQELDSFLLARVQSGRYENASEVVRAALRTLEREERIYEAKLEALRAAIDAAAGHRPPKIEHRTEAREQQHLIDLLADRRSARAR